MSPVSLGKPSSAMTGSNTCRESVTALPLHGLQEALSWSMPIKRRGGRVTPSRPECGARPHGASKAGFAVSYPLWGGDVIQVSFTAVAIVWPPSNHLKKRR